MSNRLPLYLLIASIFITSTASASNKDALGVIGGMTMSNSSVSSSTGAASSTSVDSRSGIFLDGFWDNSISDNVYFSPGITFTGKGHNPYFKASYMEIPLGVKVEANLERVSPFVWGGVSLGILLSATSEITTAGTPIEGYLNRNELCARLGLGVRWLFSNNFSFLVVGTYSQGLTNQFSDITQAEFNRLTGATGDNLKSSNLMIGAGIRFSLDPVNASSESRALEFVRKKNSGAAPQPTAITPLSPPPPETVEPQ